MHIATHGFFQAWNGVKKSSEYDTEEMQALSRSGLLMAGAVSYMRGMEIPDNVDDGILTARELAALDLTQTELITLSACETGLGDVTSEGVFGLQRGLKKAGANSILMSLWKVDDEATCMLMTEFYRFWVVEGKSKREALELAKQLVRSHKEKGWDDPKYWAAFILLDGIE
ncbi:MAG: CHAT domain-containing protein [Bacteroidaceae bacterium]|nr:CHAT domain-containing protein [Bacteroidaceae bacterium]